MRAGLMPGFLPLGSLLPAASKKYLIDNIDGASEADAERLAHDLGNQPSALNFAVSKYATRGIPETHGMPPIDPDANRELRSLWQDTFDRLQAESPLAYSLLELCSLFASDPIPEMILTLPSSGDEPPPGDLRGALTTSKYSDLVEILRDRWLLEAQPGSHEITFHSLLQTYLRENMIATLDAMDVEFELRVQLQTDPFLMPIENNAVLWPEKLSPRLYGALRTG